MLRRFAATIVVSLLWPGAVGAQDGPLSSAAPGIVFDRYMSPAAGGWDLLAIQRGIAAVEDGLLPLKFGDERPQLAVLAGVGQSAREFYFFCTPPDYTPHA